MKIYSYDPKSGAFLAQGTAYPDPMNEGGYLIPAHATEIAPPNVEGGLVAVFNGIEWDVVEDHRGTILYSPEGQKIEVKKLGPIPEGYSTTPPPEPIKIVKDRGLLSIDNDAESARAGFITAGDGQAMVYQQKVAEAEKYQAADAPDVANYPLLSAEATAFGLELSALADTVLTLRDQWLVVAAQIEATRLKAKEAVKAATSHEQIETILNGLSWPQPAE